MAVTDHWVVFDLIGVLAEPSWRDIASLAPSEWDAFKVGRTSEEEFWSGKHQKTYRKLLGFRTDRLNYLRALKDRGYRVCVATNFSAKWLDYLLEKIPDRDLFDARCVSDEVKAAKPAPEFWAKLGDRVGPGSIFIDDRRENCKAAEGAGFRSVWAHPACRLEEEVERLLSGPQARATKKDSHRQTSV